EGGPGAAREGANRRGGRFICARTVETQRSSARRDVRRSGWKETPVRLVQGSDRGAHLYLYSLPVAEFLPADGSPFRVVPEKAEGGTGACAGERPGAPRQHQLRSRNRHAGRPQKTRTSARGGSEDVDVFDRRPGRNR